MLPAMIKSRLKFFAGKPLLLPLCVSGLMVFLIAVSLFHALTFFYFQHEAALQASRLLESKSATVLSHESTVDMTAEKMKKIHLFGHTLSSSRDIPLTALNIRLTGIYFDQNPKMSQISIADDNHPEKLYHEGDTLPNGVLIDQIFQGEVIIQYNGELQKLVLFQNN